MLFLVQNICIIVCWLLIFLFLVVVDTVVVHGRASSAHLELSLFLSLIFILLILLSFIRLMVIN